MQILFYDTCALLNDFEAIFEKHRNITISNLTLKELENIKTSAHKDEDIKYRSRKLIRILQEKNKQVQIVDYNYKWDKLFKKYTILADNADSRIILTAHLLNKKEPLTFITQDACCAQIAKALGLVVQQNSEKLENYNGFIEKRMDDDELAYFYTHLNENCGNCLINQYLLIKNADDEIIDSYKWTESGFEKVPYYSFESSMLGTIKAKDPYQQCVMDSLEKNKVTLLRGCAGSGKSYLSLGFLFKQLEKHKIDKIIIFCNTVATLGSAKLGFYPGTRDEKLLDSQIGNFLASKLGDKYIVEQYIQEGKMLLLPCSDIRGYDTTGMRAGVYITEAQNLDINLIKLALQRVGEDSICILDGDSEA